MNKVLKKIFLGALVFGWLMIGGAFSGLASAATVASDDSLYKLSLLQAVRSCYKSGARTTVSTNEMSFPGHNDTERLLQWIWNGDTAVYLTTTSPKVGGNNDGAIKCSNLPAKLLQQGYAIPNTLEGLGYVLVEDGGSDDGDIVKAEFKVTGGNFGGDQSGVEVRPSGNIVCTGRKVDGGWTVDECDSDLQIRMNFDGEDRKVIGIPFYNKTSPTIESDFPAIQSANICRNRGTPECDLMGAFGGVVTGSSFANAIFGNFGSNMQGVVRYMFENFTLNSNYNAVSASTNTNKTEYRLYDNNAEKAGNIMLYNMAGIDENYPFVRISYGGVYYTWNPNYVYALYYKYLRNLQSDGRVSIKNCSTSKPSGWAFKNTATEWCSLDLEFGMEDNIKAIQMSLANDGNVAMMNGKFEDVLNWFGDEGSYSRVTAFAEGTTGDGGELNSGGTTPGGDEDGESAASRTLTDICYDSGIEGMSWMLCPAMNNMEHTATALENTIRSWLSVDSELYDSNSPTMLVWRYMRDVANVVLIIIFLVIIFSQLTGYGIDNYGVKKMLPKLVVMAILINLSFILCQIAVDLSNIFGVGLDNMFAGIGEAVLREQGLSLTTIMEGFLSHAMAAVLAIAGGAGLAAGTAIEIGSIAIGGMTPMAIIMIVLALIVVIVAILIFFLMLGARMIIIVFCMAVAPLAFACYILPNTQKLFKRWWDTFKAALLIFPICGAVGGASYIIKAIVVTANGAHIWMWIVAIFVPYLPFFMLPTLLRGAIGALGVVGGALTGMGNALRNGVRSGRDSLRQTEPFKAEQERRNRVNAARRTGFQYNRRTGEITRDANGDPVNRRMNRFQQFLAGGSIGMSAAREQAAANDNKRDTETNNMDAAVGGRIFAAQRQKDQNRQTERVGEARAGVARVSDAYARQVAENTRIEQQAKIDENVAATNYDYARQLAANDRRMQQAKINEGATVVSERYARRTAENARTNEQAKIDNVAPRITQEYANQMAANEAMREAAKIRAGAPRLRWDTVNTTAENEVRMANAQQQVGVAAVNDAIARSRAEATRDAQEYKLAFDQFANLDKTKRETEFQTSLSGSGVGSGARTRAAFDSLFKTGDMAEILNVMQGANMSTLSAEVKQSLVQSAAASGNMLLKGWAKTGGSVDLNSYITAASGGLKDYINTNAGDHALDNLDKDTLKAMAALPGSASAFSAKVLKNAAITSANQNAVSKQAIVDLINNSGNRNAIGAEFSANDLTKMSIEVATALGPAALANAIADVNKAGNETIRGNIPDPVKAVLGIS